MIASVNVRIVNAKKVCQIALNYIEILCYLMT